MNKKLLLIALGLLTTGIAKAQKTKFGIKGGLSLSKVNSFTSNNGSTENIVETNYKPGFHAGIYVNIGVNRFISLQPEIRYSQKGYSTNYSILGNERQIVASYNYLDIPLLVKIKPGGGDGFNFSAGPTVSFLLTQKYKDKGDDVVITSEDNIINEDNFRQSDVGVLLGLGYTFGGLNLGADYNFGLQKLDKNNSNIKARNQTFQVSLGIDF